MGKSSKMPDKPLTSRFSFRKSMKTLILLRHGEASAGTSGGSDCDRELTLRGRDMAADVAGHLTRKALWPDAVLCSAALRTRQTCEHILNSWKEDIRPHVTYTPQIYQAGTSTLLRFVQEEKDETACLMVVGHNPTIHQFVLLMCAPGEAQKKPEMLSTFPPASCVIIGLGVESWQEVEMREGRLLDYFYPA
jgi:phosphohistidine phosphatase